MATDREELERLRALARAKPATPREELEELRVKATEMPEGGTREAIIEPLIAIGTGLGGTVAGGLAGLAELPFVGPEEAAETVSGMQESAARLGAPETKAGQKGLETVGDIIEKGIDLARFPLSGLAGMVELISGQGIEQATETIKSVQEKGLGQTAGDRAFEITGDPLISTVAAVSPEIVGSLIPITKIAKTRSALKATIADKVKASSAQPDLAFKMKTVSNRIKAGKATQSDVLNSLDDLEVNARNVSGSRVADKIKKVTEDIKKGDTTSIGNLDDIAEEVATAAPEKSLVKYIVDGSGKLRGDPLAQETIKQGFDQGVVAVVKGASKADKAKMANMVKVMQKGKENALFAMKNRPSDIAGDSLLDRIKFIKDTNRTAGKNVDLAAKSLRGQKVDFGQPIQKFMDNLDDMGVRLDSKFKPDFKGSDIEGLAGPQAAIKNIVNRLSSGKRGVAPDAFEMHRIKRFIDENVTYGAAGEGLKGKTERVLKQLRSDLDSTLDNKFPAYNEANTIYADTVGALDALQDVAGRKMDLFGPHADKATGTLLRRMMSNAQSRVNLVDAVDNLETIARRYGADFSDDISTQMLFVDELDSVFGPVARTSLAGETAKGIKKGAEAVTGQRTVLGAGVEAVAAGAEKLRGISEKNAFKSISELLKR